MNRSRKALTRAPSAPLVQRRRARRRHPLLIRTVAVCFAVEFALLALAPRDRTTWLMENLLVALLLAAWAASSRRIALSRSSIVLIFAFLAIHEIGAHYTYSEVPYDAWLQAAGAPSLDAWLGLKRNHFDRVVHFLYGLCLTHPIREVLLQTTRMRGVASYGLPVAAVVGSSLAYELLELGWAWLAGGDAGANFLGAQGDERDGTKDMLLASTGALLAMALRAGIDLSRAPAPAPARL